MISRTAFVSPAYDINIQNNTSDLFIITKTLK